MEACKSILETQGAPMATSSILGGSQMPEEISGKDVHALGPSDNSDNGSDAVGAYGEDELDSDTDAAGTGERASVGTLGDQPDADILPDRIEPVTGPEEIAGDDVESLNDVEDLADDSEDLDAE
jgi:hypothetical protein